MNNKILLNWLPPSMESMPSPALSVLKPALQEAGFEVKIIYWNLILNNILKKFLNFDGIIYESEFNKLLPFFAYIAIQQQDEVILEKLAYHILYIKPQLHVKGLGFIQDQFTKFKRDLDQIIDVQFSEIDLSELVFVGFSSLFYQWIVATIFAKKIREYCPNINLMVGGFGTEPEALAFMKNFPLFDFASWGEGEYSLVKLSKSLSERSTLLDIPSTIYRHNNRLQFISRKTIYSNLDSSRFDISDYIEQSKNVSIDQGMIIPLEGGRGCHWQRCHFCYLNSGYKTRIKTVEAIVNEIKAQITNYNIRTFLFLDNDIIGGDLKRYEQLLDALIVIKEDYNDFSIMMAEIITRNVTYDIIQKMGIIHFQTVQIGYESPSSNLLKKINKKNTFASNLFFIKWATSFNIRINGANIIRSLLEETPNDIKEGIQNLAKLRFYLIPERFNHNYSDLSIARPSHYFNRLKQKDNLKDWCYSSVYNMLPHGFINEVDKYDLILDFMKKDYDPLWDVFMKIESHYLDNQYEYKLFRIDNLIYYRELYNGLIINELEFNKDDIHWKILEQCNKQIRSIKELKENFEFITLDALQNVLYEIETEGLIYYNDDFTEIVTIIDSEFIY